MVEMEPIYAGVSPLGENCYFGSCEAKSDPLALARPCRPTRRSSNERWRLATAGACTKSSAAPGRPIGRSRSSTTGSASRLSSEETSPIARIPGDDLLYPGALLLGNNGACFECGHAHGIGDRCVSLNVREEQFSELAAATTSTSRFRFSAPSLPPSPEALPIIAHMEALSCAPSSLRSDELALRIVECVIAAMTGDRRTQAAPTGREIRRIIEAIRLVESDAGRPLELKDMAAVAGMSKYHFLRVFRRLTGMTPHRYLISSRLRRAALALTASRRPVIAVALDAGFGDLSTFNKTFRAAFGLTPTQYRASRL